VFNNPLSFTDPTGYITKDYCPGNNTAACKKDNKKEEEKEEPAPEEVLVEGDQKQLRRMEAVDQSNVAGWINWTNHQNIMADATAGFLISQAELNGGSYVWKGFVINTTKEALTHYFEGDGESVQLGGATKLSVRSHPLVVRQSVALRSGKAKHLTDNLSVELVGKVFHVGKTRVDFATNCQSGSCTTTYKAFDGDGFWDPIAPAGYGDGLGGDWELKGGKGYFYIPYIWSETYLDKF
jgi:hypothetical protein